MKQLALVVILSVGLASVFGQDAVTEKEYISNTDKQVSESGPNINYISFPLPVIFLGNSEIISSTLGVGGSSSLVNTDNGTYYVNSSIGQPGAIGTFKESGYALRQGFQQPVNAGIWFEQDPDNPFRIKVYPNPFKQSISISFGEIIDEEVLISLYDISGRIVVRDKYPASPLIIIPLGGIFDGTYILRITIGNRDYRTQLIKQYR